MIAALQALGLGVLVGALFGFVGLSVPAPNNLPGVAGVAGLFAGWIAVTTFMGRNA